MQDDFTEHLDKEKIFPYSFDITGHFGENAYEPAWLEWCEENIGREDVNWTLCCYVGAVSLGYGEYDPYPITLMLFKTEEDLMAFILRWL